MRVAIITASTPIYRGHEEDKSGKVIQHIVEKAGHKVVFMKPLPCDKTVLSTVMQRMADGHLVDLILTTGGSGCAAGDCMPEATLEIADRQVVGIPEAMRAYTFLNRSAAGIRGDVLMVNLPGKPNAVKQCLEYLLPEITHAVGLIQQEQEE